MEANVTTELTRLEEQILLSVWKLQGDAYGLAIYDHIQRITGKDLAIGGIYFPLERLVKKGYLIAIQGEPTPVRGGRSKRYYRLTELGVEEMLKTRKIQEAFWEGLSIPKAVTEES
jgi:PadR family transcriptional regulator PadR